MKHGTELVRLAIVPAVCAGLLMTTPAPAEAGWLSSTFHKATHAVHHAANKVKHAAHHAANQVKHTAEKAGQDIKKGAAKAGQDIEKGAKASAAEIEKGAKAAAAEMGKLSGQLTQITGHCQSALDKFGHQVSHAIPPLAVAAIPELRTSKCEIAETSGFMCGIFPYANGIVKAVAEGAHDMKSLGHHIHGAYEGHLCSHFSKLDPNRSVCALFVGLAKETEESVECIVDVAKEISKGGRSNRRFDETEICHFAGNVMFGFVADKLALAGVAEEKRKLVKFAQLLRSALVAKGTAAKSFDHIASCRKARR